MNTISQADKMEKYCRQQTMKVLFFFFYFAFVFHRYLVYISIFIPFSSHPSPSILLNFTYVLIIYDQDEN